MVDSESDLWMYTGCAVRMAYDLGLHLVRHSHPFPSSLTGRNQKTPPKHHQKKAA
jgi:hypothetical protein